MIVELNWDMEFDHIPTIAQRQRGGRLLRSLGMDPENQLHLNGFLCGALQMPNAVPDQKWMKVHWEVEPAIADQARAHALRLLRAESRRAVSWLSAWVCCEGVNTGSSRHDLEPFVGLYPWGGLIEAIHDAVSFFENLEGAEGMERLHRMAGDSLGPSAPLVVEQVYCYMQGVVETTKATRRPSLDGVAAVFINAAMCFSLAILMEYVPPPIMEAARQLH